MTLKHSYYFTNAIAILRETNCSIFVVYTPTYTNSYAYAHLCTDTTCTYLLYHEEKQLHLPTEKLIELNLQEKSNTVSQILHTLSLTWKANMILPNNMVYFYSTLQSFQDPHGISCLFGGWGRETERQGEMFRAIKEVSSILRTRTQLC